MTEPYSTKVLNEIDATTELLEKRGEIYSSRPRFVASYVIRLSMSILLTYYRNEILSEGKRGLSAPYGEYWRKWRKVSSIFAQRVLISYLIDSDLFRSSFSIKG